MQLTQQEKRIKIAEACGINIPAIRERDGWNCPLHIPDYFNDLNAMHSAEQFLDRTTGMKSVNCHIRSYWLHLMEIMNPGITLWDNGTFIGTWSNAIKVGGATSEQRAEAFGKTLNLW